MAVVAAMNALLIFIIILLASKKAKVQPAPAVFTVCISSLTRRKEERFSNSTVLSDLVSSALQFTRIPTEQRTGAALTFLSLLSALDFGGNIPFKSKSRDGETIASQFLKAFFTFLRGPSPYLAITFKGQCSLSKQHD